MCVWWISLSLFLISHISGDYSQCHDDQQCPGLKCCLGHCTSRTFCPCRRNADCPLGETCFLSSLRCRPMTPRAPKATHSSTPDTTSAPYTHPIYCARDNECKGSFVCKDRQCVDSHRSGQVKKAWSRSEAIVAVAFVASSIIIACLCFLCKKVRSRLARSRMTREAALIDTTRVTYREMQPGSPSVIFMDEYSFPLGAPPPYSSLEFERQIDEPPSYDDTVRNGDFSNASGGVADDR